MALSFLCLFWHAIFCSVQSAALFHWFKKEEHKLVISPSLIHSLKRQGFWSWKGRGWRKHRNQVLDKSSDYWETVLKPFSCQSGNTLFVNPQPKPYKNHVSFLKFQLARCRVLMQRKRGTQTKSKKHERADWPLKSLARERGGHHLGATALAWEVWNLKSIIFLGQ